MATAAVQLPTPSYNRVEVGSCQLKAASFPELESSPPPIDIYDIASKWAADLTTALTSDISGINHLFLNESYWRDQLGLSWDYHTLHGPDGMISFLRKAPNGSRIKAVEVDSSSDFRKPNAAPVDFDGKLKGIASFLKVETDVGRGRGIVRLLQDAKDGKWKAFTLFTAMHELKGCEEMAYKNRPNGVDHGGKPGRKVGKSIPETRCITFKPLGSDVGVELAGTPYGDREFRRRSGAYCPNPWSWSGGVDFGRTIATIAGTYFDCRQEPTNWRQLA